MTMLAAIVLGTGLPTTPSYILLTALLIPAIMKLGVIEPAAHMFAFYYRGAVRDHAAGRAGGVRGGGPRQGGHVGFRLGGDEDRRRRIHRAVHVRLSAGAADDRHLAGDHQGFITSCIGIALFAGGLHGYFVTAASFWQRALLTAGGMCLVFPGVWTDLAGAGLAGIVVVTQLLERRDQRAQSAKQAQ